jgi:hypothetical protein
MLWQILSDEPPQGNHRGWMSGVQPAGERTGCSVRMFHQVVHASHRNDVNELGAELGLLPVVHIAHGSAFFQQSDTPLVG